MSVAREVIWFGPDGSEWPLHGPGMGTKGVYLTSLRGIYHPVRVPLDTRPAYMQGARPGLPKTDPRVIDLKIFTTATTPEEWEDVENEWWDAWSDEEDGTMRVFNRAGTYYRDIDLRLQKYPDNPFDWEPDEVFDWDMPTIAYDPWWRGPTVTSTWTPGGELKFANPGDVETWPHLMLENLGLGEQYTVPDGIDGDTVELEPLDPSEGDLLVDTDQMRLQMETAANTQFAARMAAMKFRNPIPPRTPPTVVPVSVAGGNASAKVKAYMSPLYKRPW